MELEERVTANEAGAEARHGTTCPHCGRPAVPAAPRDAAPGGAASDAAELDRLRSELAQLREAMASRPVIDQARGMVMALNTCPPHTAWRILLEVSQHTNIKLRSVAAQLVATTYGELLPDDVGRALGAAMRRAGAGSEPKPKPEPEAGGSPGGGPAGAPGAASDGSRRGARPAPEGH